MASLYDDLKLQDICDINELVSMLKNYSLSTGLSVGVFEPDGTPIFKTFSMSELCEIIRQNEAGESRCIANRCRQCTESFVCHAGFLNYYIQMKTVDGHDLGFVFAGQILSDGEDEDSVWERVKDLGLSEDSVKTAVRRSPLKRKNELQGSYGILRQMVEFYISKNYEVWKENSAFEDVVSAADIGLWRIILEPDEAPRMIANRKMCELLGVEVGEYSPEALYDFWYGHVKSSAYPSVNASVAEMMAGKKSENTYYWINPGLGERIVRCGGLGLPTPKGGYCLRGYHSDVTEIVQADMRQKQMLADALEETTRQKRLLEKALEDYRRADCDRRTDFLTGLRNRQDLYEMLNDDASSARNRVRAMFMMDIDFFKMYNDHYGHVAGDDCLRKICKTLKEFGDSHNIEFYRYGGEEILGVYFSDDKPASMMARELVDLVYNLRIKREDVPLGYVTISVGYTIDTSDLEMMIYKADTAMYRAKFSGKNRAVGNEE